MSKCNRFYVYIHRFRNGTLYVGKGTKRRAYVTWTGRHNVYWDRLLKKYGNPRVRIISNGMTEPDALNMEREIIKRLRTKDLTLCNMTLGGDGALGLAISDETRRKLSVINSGERNSMFGRIHSDEAKSRISEANTGRFTGKKSSRYKENVFDFVNEDGVIFSGTQWELSDLHGVPQSQASMLCSGASDSARGWRLSTTPIELTGRKGSRHGRYDHTVFNFRHDSGIEEFCTKYELAIKYNLPHPSNLTNLCKGKLPSYRGWRLL